MELNYNKRLNSLNSVVLTLRISCLQIFKDKMGGEKEFMLIASSEKTLKCELNSLFKTLLFIDQFDQFLLMASNI